MVSTINRGSGRPFYSHKYVLPRARRPPHSFCSPNAFKGKSFSFRGNAFGKGNFKFGSGYGSHKGASYGSFKGKGAKGRGRGIPLPSQFDGKPPYVPQAEIVPDLVAEPCKPRSGSINSRRSNSSLAVTGPPGHWFNRAQALPASSETSYGICGGLFVSASGQGNFPSGEKSENE